MEKEKKTSQIIVRMTEREKNFLEERAEEEDRTISSVVKGALREKYKEFGEMGKKRGE